MPRLTDLGHGKLDCPKLDPRDVIIRKGFNYRDTTTPAAEAHILWLMESIKATGVQEPIRVEFDDGKAYLVNGECRLIACQRLWKAGEVKVPYKEGGYGPPLIPAIQKSGDEAEILAASMVANGSLPPSKMEFGAAAARLEAHGWPKEKIALYIPPHIGAKGSKAVRYVREAVELHQAPLDVKEAVRNGVDGVKVTDSLALAATKKGREKAPEIIREAVNQAKSKGETVAKRPKHEGEVAKKRNEFQAFTDRLLDAADLLAQMILADNVMLPEVQRKARQYQKLRSA